jgi:hypothetical protein
MVLEVCLEVLKISSLPRNLADYFKASEQRSENETV